MITIIIVSGLGTRQGGFAQATYVVTSAPIAEETKRQLPEIAENIVVGSARKDVANALYFGIR